MSGYDYDLVVIGAGSGGARAARLAARDGARVAIVESDRIGGTCVLRGCVPKKLFVTASHFAEAFEDSVAYGWSTEAVRFDWPTLRDNVQKEVERLSGIYRRNLDAAGAEIILARAVFEDAHRIRLIDGNGGEDRIVSAAHVIVATGARSSIDPSVSGLELTVTSNEMFLLEKLPKHFLVIGGGYIAVEFAGVFNGLGVDTTLLYRGEEILRGFDGDIRKSVRAGMEQRGVTVRCGQSIEAVERSGGRLMVRLKSGERIETDLILSAIGRKPNTENLGLEKAGVEIREDGANVVDRFQKTSVDHIYAVGDVTNRVQLTPVAIREGAAVVNTLFRGKPTSVDYDDIPTAVFSQPEAGTVGLTEEAAKASLAAVDIYRTAFRPLANTVSGREERTMMKLVVDGTTDRVVGCHVVGPGAGEMAQLLGVAVKAGATKADFDATMAVHPTSAEEFVTIGEPVERYRRAAAE